MFLFSVYRSRSQSRMIFDWSYRIKLVIKFFVLSSAGGEFPLRKFPLHPTQMLYRVADALPKQMVGMNVENQLSSSVLF